MVDVENGFKTFNIPSEGKQLIPTTNISPRKQCLKTSPPQRIRRFRFPFLISDICLYMIDQGPHLRTRHKVRSLITNTLLCNFNITIRIVALPKEGWSNK